MALRLEETLIVPEKGRLLGRQAFPQISVPVIIQQTATKLLLCSVIELPSRQGTEHNLSAPLGTEGVLCVYNMPWGRWALIRASPEVMMIGRWSSPSQPAPQQKRDCLGSERWKEGYQDRRCSLHRAQSKAGTSLNPAHWGSGKWATFLNHATH